ncbi:putative KRR1 interacting protein [Helianthus annuus]|nr:putative KRR1 interacting protein [Helianthus annuus]
MGMKLFGDEGGEAGDISKIEINQEFARRFEHNKKREDLQRYEELKKKGVIDDSEEDDESSDDDEEIVNYSTKQDLKFFDALIKVRNKDPLLKSNEAKLFDSDNEEDDDDDEGGDGKKEKEKKKKPMFLKDVNAKHLIGNGPEFDDEDDERDNKNRKKSYFEEQEEVRKEFLDAVADEEDDDEEQKENEEQKELSRKQRRKMRLKEFKISDKRRMAYEGSTSKSNKKNKHKSKDAV